MHAVNWNIASMIDENIFRMNITWIKNKIYQPSNQLYGVRQQFGPKYTTRTKAIFLKKVDFVIDDSWFINRVGKQSIKT